MSLTKPMLVVAAMMPAVAVSSALSLAVAADPTPAVRIEAVVIAKGATQSLQMKTKKALQKVVNPKDKVLRAASIPNDPTTLLLTGLAPGVSRLTLTDINGKEERLLVVVEDGAHLEPVAPR